MLASRKSKYLRGIVAFSPNGLTYFNKSIPIKQQIESSVDDNDLKYHLLYEQNEQISFTKKQNELLGEKKI